jgi:hypothetical protein
MLAFIASHVTVRKLTQEQQVRLAPLTGGEIAEAANEGKRALVNLGLTATMADRVHGLPGSKLRELEEIDRPDAIHVEVDLPRFALDSRR